MRLSSFAPLLALFPAFVKAQYDIASPPFNLVVLSDNSTLNGTVLYSCHEGASIEGLCTGGTNNPAYSSYTHNTSSNAGEVNKTIGAPGYLIWVLPAGTFNESETLSLNVNPISNVALPLFWPSIEDSTSVAFDDNGLLNIQGYFDDRVVPIVSSTAYVAYYRWYVCTTYYEGYTYQTLAWALGEFPPENPTCQAVSVKQVFL